jgi:Flp pilus assembly protein TadG
MLARLVGLRRLLRDRAGIAALEFALIGPVMALMIVGTIELGNILRLQAKLNVAAGQLAELIAGQSAVVSSASVTMGGASSLSDMCAGAADNILPYDLTAFAANIASITNVSNAQGVTPNQDWESDTACPATAIHAGYAVMEKLADTPRSLLTKDGSSWNGGSGGSSLGVGYSAIIVNVSYTYANFLPYFLSRYVNLTAVAVARPRSNTTIACTTTPVGGTNPVSCPQNY